MASMTNAGNVQTTSLRLVVHPLDDVPEKKRDVSSLGPMAMTKSVRTSLLVLRAYLILMASLVVYRFISLF